MKRKIEVFSAGCPRCEETISRIQDLACPDCEVVVVNMHEAEGNRRAKELDVRTVPAVAIDDQLAACCAGRGPEAEVLRRAGLGQALS